jgi:hypothetical protein
MTAPKKINAWSQGLYKVSTTKKECLGALRETEDGRKFRYAKAGGTLIPGGGTYGAAVTANHSAQVQTSGAANTVGSIQVSVYVAGTAVTANQYDDGYLIVYRTATGTQGLIYPIASHTVSTAGSEIITVTLKEPLVKATLTTDYFTLVANPWSGIIASKDVATNYTGQAFVSVASGEYCWVQTGGIGVATGGDTAAMGYPVGPSDTESCLEVASTQVGPVIGYAYGTDLVSGYCTPVNLWTD